MSFTAKVKKTGQLFQGTNEWSDEDGILGRDAHQLEKGKSYSGHLFDAFPAPNAASAEYSRVEHATFDADELEEMDFERLRLIRVTPNRVRNTLDNGTY